MFCGVRVRPYLRTHYRPRVIPRHGACGHICPGIHMHACQRTKSARPRSGSPDDTLHRTGLTSPGIHVHLLTGAALHIPHNLRHFTEQSLGITHAITSRIDLHNTLTWALSCGLLSSDNPRNCESSIQRLL